MNEIFFKYNKNWFVLDTFYTACILSIICTHIWINVISFQFCFSENYRISSNKCQASNKHHPLINVVRSFTIAFVQKLYKMCECTRNVHQILTYVQQNVELYKTCTKCELERAWNLYLFCPYTQCKNWRNMYSMLMYVFVNTQTLHSFRIFVLATTPSSVLFSQLCKISRPVFS